MARVAFANGVLEGVAARNRNIRVLRLDRMICDATLCRSAAGKLLFYRDVQHLSDSGAMRAVPALEELIAR